MGYFVNYTVAKLTIPASRVQEALQAINALHIDEALEKNARGGSYPSEGKPVRQRKCTPG